VRTRLRLVPDALALPAVLKVLRVQVVLKVPVLEVLPVLVVLLVLAPRVLRGRPMRQRKADAVAGAVVAADAERRRRQKGHRARRRRAAAARYLARYSTVDGRPQGPDEAAASRASGTADSRFRRRRRRTSPAATTRITWKRASCPVSSSRR